MKLVAIRDDDVSFFTDTARFAGVHGPLLERGVPVNLAVIPLASANVKVRHEKMQGYEPFIPPPYRGQEACFDVGENRELIEFITSHPSLHVVQHGCRHEYVNDAHEFAISDTKKLSEMVRDGARTIEKAFGARPDFFVAPWDKISRTAYPVLASRFKGISTGWLGKADVPLAWLPKLLIKKLQNRNYIFAENTIILEHPGCILSRFNPPEEITGRIMAYVDTHDVAVLVTHHWEYYGEDGTVNNPFLAAYHETIAELSKREGVRIVSFHEMRRALKSRD